MPEVYLDKIFNVKIFNGVKIFNEDIQSKDIQWSFIAKILNGFYPLTLTVLCI